MSMKLPLRIGTRGSPLALAQAHEVRDLLVQSGSELAAPGALEIVEIKTSGDKITDRALAEVGGKGLFSKEIDDALLEGRIDLAVHSLKDLETWIPEGISLVSVLDREDPRDAFISMKSHSLNGLAPGSVIGTSSLRRKAQILRSRPDLETALFRGNVQTRLRKLKQGVADATLLAVAGLNRLGLSDIVTEVLEPDVLLPAVAQGAIGLTCRSGDAEVADILRSLNHTETMVRITAERALLAALDGSCRTPIGGLAEFEADGSLRLRALVAKEDGTEVFETERRGARDDAEVLGRDAGEELRSRAGPEICAP